jgi:hypothetical protein
MILSNSISGQHLLISDFDQTLSFHDSGLVLGEIPGVSDLRERIEGLARIRFFCESNDFSLREWSKVRTDTITLGPAAVAVEAAAA